MRRRFEQGIKEYTYTIHSDCIGGSLYIDNNYIDVIPDSGIYIFTSPVGGDKQVSIQYSHTEATGSYNREHEYFDMRCNTSFPAQYSMSFDVTSTTQKIFLYPGRYIDTIRTNHYIQYFSPNPTTCEENGEVTMNANTSTYYDENVINTRLVTNSDLEQRAFPEYDNSNHPLYRYVDSDSPIPYTSPDYPKGLQITTNSGDIFTMIGYWNDTFVKSVNPRFYAESDSSKICTVRLNAII